MLLLGQVGNLLVILDFVEQGLAPVTKSHPLKQSIRMMIVINFPLISSFHAPLLFLLHLQLQNPCKYFFTKWIQVLNNMID